ncbi:MAG: hypothetical protein KGQ47_04365 [Hyphomicrobiales bacterium]|nr:hypothetical protein [Hyphomicrobiales bacterium]
MFRLSRCLRACALFVVFVLLPFSHASAHCFVGPRFFPATLTVDDPCVADEMSLPTVDWFKTGDIPSASQTDVSAEFDKRITEDLGFGISDVWSQIRTPGGPVAVGLGNLETTLQYQLLKNASTETAMLLGLEVDWGGTGNTSAGIATQYSTLTPTYYFGQGFGGLPDELGFARPLALTGQIGYQIPTTSFDTSAGAFIPQVLVYGASLQYSMPYLKSEVKDLQLPDFFNHLIPIVEMQLFTPVMNNMGNPSLTTGTINPGVIYVGSTYQVGFEAIVPVNGASGNGVGVMGQLHLYLDDMFPKTLGRPLIGGTSAPPANSF